MIRERTSSVAALSDTAKLTGYQAASSRIAGTIPAVETVTLFPASANPNGESRISIARDTSGTFSSGSPIPMKTTFVSRSPRPASRRAAKHAWCMISADVRLRRNPDLPVAQNRHDSAHPACVDTHKVRRPSSGISTLSIDSPSSRRNRNFSVPSRERSVSSATGHEIRHEVINSCRKSLERSDIAENSSTCFR